MAEMRDGLPVGELIASVNQAGYGEHNSHLTVGPLYHGGPLMQAVRAVMGGGRIHIMRRFDPEEVLHNIEFHQVTNTLLVPTHCVRMLRLPEETRNRYDLSSLVQAYHIGAMMPVDVKRAMIDWWGPVLVDAYGCSELGVIAWITSPEWLDKPGSVGRPVPWFTIQIIGEDDTELPPGEIGTVYITALNDADIVYLGDPDKTAAAHRGPRQFTLNDLGYLDEDGYLFLVDRRVDLIISGGVNIYPAEIEAEILAHPAVEDVGVFAIPHPEWGHEVKAAVQLRSGHRADSDTEAEILGWLRERLAHYKVPRSIDFHEQLPRFTNGKLHRRALRDPYWEQDRAEAVR
jgi:long-chain acyl-CoA synthetase